SSELTVLCFQAEDGIRDRNVTGVQTCALPISLSNTWYPHPHMIRFYSLQIKEKSIVPKDMKFLNSEGQPKAYRSSIFCRSKKMNGSMQSFQFPNIMRTNTCSLRHAMVFPSGRNFPNLPTSVKTV